MTWGELIALPATEITIDIHCVTRCGLELRPADQPGFWERYGYHNDADYRQEQRYGF